MVLGCQEFSFGHPVDYLLGCSKTQVRDNIAMYSCSCRERYWIGFGVGLVLVMVLYKGNLSHLETLPRNHRLHGRVCFYTGNENLAWERKQARVVLPLGL